MRAVRGQTISPNMSVSLQNLSTSKIRVRYAETDQMGVVYHANFLVWFEIGRVELIRQLGLDYKQLEIEEGCHIAVIEASCRYKAPARYDDELLIETRLTGVRQSVLKYAYRILRDDGGSLKLLAEGQTTHVVVDGQLRKTGLPERYRAALSKFMTG